MSTRARGRAVAVLLVAAVSGTAGCTVSANDPASGAQKTPEAVGTGLRAATIPRAATTPVYPSSPGDIRHTVAVGAASAKPAVALTAVGTFGGRVTVHVSSIKATTAHARGPGEVSGPGLVLAVRIDNASAKAIDLGNVVVALEGSTHVPASPMAAPPAHGFAGSLAAGAHASAVYVFTLPTAQRRPVTLKVSYSAEAPVVVFVGDAP